MKSLLRVASVMMAGLILNCMWPGGFLCQARVLRTEVLSRTAIHADTALGTPAYEKVEGRVFFAVKPADPHNRGIVDLDKAPRNAQGEVEFSADLFLLRPMEGGNGALLLEIPNRGGKGLLSLVEGGKSDPATAAELGDGWLLKRGFTFASLGWQWDAPEDAGSLRLHAPVAHEHGANDRQVSRQTTDESTIKSIASRGESTIYGLLRSDYTASEKRTDLPLGHLMGTRLGGTEYPVAMPEDRRNVLTVRDSPHAARRVIARSKWSFAHSVDGKLAASDRFVHLPEGFEPGKIYELVYVVKDPVVAGLGFAAVRDFVADMKQKDASEGGVKFAYAAGISQCGRFWRDFLYQGFNADESGTQVLDGVLAHVGGAGRGSFNYRFAQPSRDGQPMSSIDWPTDIFPFTDQPERDPYRASHKAAGLLDRAAAEHVVPKIFLSHTSYEYWGRAASLIHTMADGSADMPLSSAVRIYFYAGLQHYSVPFPPEKGTGDRLGQQLPSPLPVKWFWRAMIANMDGWVRSDLPPPASRYPRIADGTLVPRAKLHFPHVEGVQPPSNQAEGWDLDFGENWRSGLLSKQPPLVRHGYQTLVPQVDADGNDLGGIRLPEITVPLATYTGWNLRDRSIGAADQRTAFLGSFLPLPLTGSAAGSASDQRAPIDSRYRDYDAYRAAFVAATEKLIGEGYVLGEDRDAILTRSWQEWDWVHAHGAADTDKKP